MTTDNQKFKEEFKEKYGVYPVTEEDIPEEELYIMTPEQIAQGEKGAKIGAALEYLKHTDWYAHRKAETGKAIPDDVLEKRAQARIDASSE